MTTNFKKRFLAELVKRFGALKRIGDGKSLYEIADGTVRIYIRCSAVHPKGKTFYGLREVDLRNLHGHPSVICFLWENQETPLIVPFSDYEQVFQKVSPAGDGQFKAHVYLRLQGTELYIANAGRFNVEDYLGWSALENLVDSSVEKTPELSHSQVQTLLGSIGAAKGFDIWVPTVDRCKLDWSCVSSFSCCDVLPYGFEAIPNVLQEIDVLWIQRGSGQISALFEVEHSTPIYSGLLRFNDVHLVAPNLKPQFSIVANDNRRELFATQLNRPTFKRSGLSDLCSFLEYINVFRWHKQITKT